MEKVVQKFFQFEDVGLPRDPVLLSDIFKENEGHFMLCPRY